MGTSNRINIAVERAQSKEDGIRETAGAVSHEANGRTAEAPYVLFDVHRRPSKGRAAIDMKEKGTLGRGGSAMGPRTADIGEQIGRELRGLYDDVVAQPVPDRFLDLLNRLEKTSISRETRTKAPGEM